jgi:hypothetical protein
MHYGLGNDLPIGVTDGSVACRVCLDELDRTPKIDVDFLSNEAKSLVFVFEVKLVGNALMP